MNRPNVGLGMGGGHLNLGGRVNPPAYMNQDSALTNSVLSQQRMNGQDPRYMPQLPPDDFAPLHVQQQQPPPPPYDPIQSIDAGLVSDPGSKYGSPIEDSRFPMSPKNMTALDAPLPSSFDSEGVSQAPRYGPMAASMPSKFGAELSSPVQRPGVATDSVRALHDTAYGPDLRKASAAIGSSPPGVSDDFLPEQRFMHSQRTVKAPRMVSASVPRLATLDDWDENNFPMEEDYLPTNLHDDVLTPQERLRRLSRTDNELSSSHRDPSGLGMASNSFSKIGSPLGSSPSRFGALFARQRQKKEEESHASSFTHVGSPLRESAFSLGSSANVAPIGSRQLSGDISPFVSSPKQQSSMSIISQQLSGFSPHPSFGRQQPSATSSGSRFDRTISSPVSTNRIDEEQSDLVFSMEEEENNKRNSASWGTDKASSNDGESTPTSNLSFRP